MCVTESGPYVGRFARVEVRFGPVDVGYRAAAPSNPIDTARSRFDAALHAERVNVDNALEAAKQQAAKDAARIRELETALQTVQRLSPNDAGIRQIVKQALGRAA